MNYENQKALNLKYGLINEKIIKPILEKVFNKILCKSIKECAIFDFYDIKHRFIFELKSYTYSYSKYQTVIIGVNKGLCNNCIFVFYHEQKELYYIQYNNELFKTFKTDYIYYMGKSTLCYRIPKQYIIEINTNKIYKLTYYKADYNLNKKLIDNDKKHYIIDINRLIKQYYKSQYKYNINLLISRKPLLHIDNFLTYITTQINNNNLYIKYLEPIKYEIPI